MPVYIAVAIAVAFVGWEMLYLARPDQLGLADTILTLPSDLSQAGLLQIRLRRAAVADPVT